MSLLSHLSIVHPLFRYGFPHREPEELIPIPTSAHFIMFDVARVGPRFTMHRIIPSTESRNVPRDDDFVPEFTLPMLLQTRRSDYAVWNKQNPDDPMDMGHQTGSQLRRTDRLVQHDVDSLSGVCPETPELNRKVKNKLECAIAKRAAGFIDVRAIQGPGWFSDPSPYRRIDKQGRTRPRGKLQSGQWIPDFMWISTLWRSNTKLEVHSFVMKNDQEAVQLEVVATTDLESRINLVLWDSVKDGNFKRAKEKPGKGDWFSEI